MKTTRIFHLKVFIFLVVKFSVNLNRRVCVISNHVVAGSNPAGGEIQLMTEQRFIAQSLSLLPFHRLDMT